MYIYIYICIYIYIYLNTYMYVAVTHSMGCPYMYIMSICCINTSYISATLQLLRPPRTAIQYLHHRTCFGSLSVFAPMNTLTETLVPHRVVAPSC